MKIKNLSILVLCITALCNCTNSVQEDGLGHHHHDHGSHGEQSEEIILKQSDAERFGVYTKMVKPQQFSEVVKVSGQIITTPVDQTIVTAASSGIVSYFPGIIEGKKVVAGEAIASISARGLSGGDANESARIVYESAKQELERIEPLHKDGIVSTKEYNAVRKAFEQAKTAYSGSSSGSTAKTISSGVLTNLLVKQGEFVNAGQPIAAISGNTRLTLRADLPEKYFNFLPNISTANIRVSYSSDVITLDKLNGKIVPSDVVSVQPGYIPVYFTFDNNGMVVPGSFAEVYLIGKKRPDVIVLPIEAVTEQQGNFYVYVKLDAECYEKRPVTLGNTDGKNVEICSGLTRKDEVVSQGAIIVKLAEASGAIPEGHSHSH